jgi:hypothetical protein
MKPLLRLLILSVVIAFTCCIEGSLDFLGEEAAVTEAKKTVINRIKQLYCSFFGNVTLFIPSPAGAVR